jgi:hypothetical protein
MVYPALQSQVSEEELTAHFTLNLEKLELVRRFPKENLGSSFAILIKTYQSFDYPPHPKNNVSGVVIDRISDQKGLSPDLFRDCPQRDRLWHLHRSMVQDHTEFHHMESKDYSELLE